MRFCIDTKKYRSYISHMETISVSNLKSHLSAELKRIEGGIALTVVDHKRPVAVLSPIKGETLFMREARYRYVYEPFEPLLDTDPLIFLNEERGSS